MRIRRLGLERFGSLSEVELDFSAGAPGGLHVVYGANEAGKSTSRRAVTALLFGIPERSEDAHTHGAREMRLWGELERPAAGGVEILRIARRKRRKDPLLDAEGRALSESTLAPYLLGVDRASFVTRYALDQKELEAGARALLSGAEEGLFAAGAAGAGVGRMLADLVEKQNALYRPRGQKYTLNVVLEQLKEAERALRMAERPAEKWQEQRRAYEAALEEAATIEEERRLVRSELSRSNRYAAVLSEVTELVEAEAELVGLEGTPLLAVDAAEQRALAETAERDAGQACRVHEAELHLLEARLTALGPATSLEREDEERLGLLRNQLGSELKAWADLPKRRAKLAQLDEQVALVVRSLGRAGAPAESLLIDAVREASLRQLATEHGRLASDALALGRHVERLGQELGGIVRELESKGPEEQSTSVSLDALRTFVAQARVALGEFARLDGMKERLRARREEQRALGRELGRDVDALAPPRRPLEALVERHGKLALSRRELLAEQRKQQEILAESSAQAELLEQSLDLPSEAQLSAARGRRDGLLRNAFERSSGQAPPDASEVFAAVEGADTVADRLRREAQRVSEHVALRATAAAARARLEVFGAARAELEVQEDALAREFRDYFGGEVRVPAESALRHHDDWQRLMVLSREVRELDAEVTHLEEISASWRERLSQVLTESERRESSPDWPLGELLVRAERRLERVQTRAGELSASRRRKGEIERQLALDRAALSESERRLSDWQTEWARASEPLGLGDSPSVSEVGAYLSRLGELGMVLGERREMRRRVEGIERDTRAFAELLGALAERHAPELLGKDPLEGAELLLARASAARETGAERARTLAEVERRRTALREASQRRDAARRRLGELLQAAGAADPDELSLIELRSTRRRELASRVARLEESLRGRAGGQTARDLVREVRGQDHDRLAVTILELEDRLAALDERQKEAARDVVSLQQGLQHYGTEDASEARQRASHRRSAAEHALRDLLVLKAAHALLASEMEEFAQANQSSLLGGARELFSRITLGKYQGLEVGFEDTELRCESGDRVTLVSELSSGTRAQLYLALRLASLWSVDARGATETHDPFAPPDLTERLPLILDDLFVEFDDDRATAAFEVLGEFAERGQILYFTHLARDVEAATDAVPPSRLFVHTLGT